MYTAAFKNEMESQGEKGSRASMGVEGGGKESNTHMDGEAFVHSSHDVITAHDTNPTLKRYGALHGAAPQKGVRSAPLFAGNRRIPSMSG